MRDFAPGCCIWWKARKTSAPKFVTTLFVVLPQPPAPRTRRLAEPKKPSSSFVVAGIRGSSKQQNRCSP